jgi:hypothetical protein
MISLSEVLYIISCGHLFIQLFYRIESAASQKNELLAVVLIMTGCPSATLRDGEEINVFVNTLKQASMLENVDARIKLCTVPIKISIFLTLTVLYHCTSMPWQLYQYS